MFFKIISLASKFYICLKIYNQSHIFVWISLFKVKLNMLLLFYSWVIQLCWSFWIWSTRIMQVRLNLWAVFIHIYLLQLTEKGLKCKFSDVFKAVKKATNSLLNATRLQYQLIYFNLILLDLALTHMPPMPDVGNCKNFSWIWSLT